MIEKLNWEGDIQCPECKNKVTGIDDPDTPLCPLCGCFLDNPPKRTEAKTKSKE